MMNQYSFTLYLDRKLEETQEPLDRLYEAGCDDGSPAKSNGVSLIMFHREAESFEDAVRSAIEDVRKGGYGVIRIETDESHADDRFNSQLANA